MSRRILPLIALTVFAGVSSQCRKAPAPSAGTPGSEPLAVVAGRPITAEDLVREAGWRQANRQAVPEAGELLEEMVRRESLLELARQSGLADEPEVRRRIESLLIARLRERDLEPAVAGVTVDDEEVRASYEQRKEEFTRKGLDRFAVLFQAVSPKSSDARRAEARERLEAGLKLADAAPATGGRGPAAGGFGAVAIDHSDDQTSRYRGGDIGWIEAGAETGRWPAALIEAGRALEKGARSGIVECEDGLYVIMKTDSRPGGALPFDEVSERIRRALVLSKRRELEERFVASALEAAAATSDPAAAREVVLPPGPSGTADEAPPSFPGIARPSASH